MSYQCLSLLHGPVSRWTGCQTMWDNCNTYRLAGVQAVAQVVRGMDFGKGQALCFLRCFQLY
jgi:hypothetical protein